MERQMLQIQVPALRVLVLAGITTAILILSAAPASAAFCTRRRPEAEQQLADRRIAVLDELQGRADETRRTQGAVRHLSDKDAARFRTLSSRMTARLEAAQDRERQLCGRLDRNIIALAARGRDMTTAKNSLIRAEHQWLETGLLLEELKLKIASVPDAGNPLTAFQEVRSLVRGVTEHLGETNTALLDAVETVRRLTKE